MLILIFGILALFFGYMVYSRFVESLIKPFKEPTPAIRMRDGIDYVPMSTRKNTLIQFLNIAGTGPIFGALMGAKWGPIVFLWIIFGTILGGAVHDYMVGMMSMRNDGASAPKIITTYLGGWTKYPMLLLVVFLMIMVAATFAKSAGELLVELSGLPFEFWLALIIIYFLVSTLLPIHKVIGRIYPVFGILLIIMAANVIAGLIIGGYSFPAMSFENLHPAGLELFPDMCITVACGAISGFHASQSPLVARCTKEEYEGRRIFYGAMVLEAVIAFIWASAGLAYYGGTEGLTSALDAHGASAVIYDLSIDVAGSIGGVLAIIGVIICPVTSGDTALRCARMMVQDAEGYGTQDLRTSLFITLGITAFIVLLCFLDFTVLWNYFGWFNQSVACIMLWAATVFLYRTATNRYSSLATALPAVFMTLVVTSFIISSGQGLGLGHTVGMFAGAILTAIAAAMYLRMLFGRKGREAPDTA